MVPSSAKFCSQWCFDRNNNGSWNIPQKWCEQEFAGRKNGQIRLY